MPSFASSSNATLEEARKKTFANIDLNTQFGAYYFKYWLDRLDRMPALAAAAYNAGPRRAQQWRIGAPLEGAIWVETIPFNETRDYVKKVLANTTVYAALISGKPQSLKERLTMIPPRRDDDKASDTPVEFAEGADPDRVAQDKRIRAYAATNKVDYATADGTALAPIDYVAATGHLVFEPGSTALTVPITIHSTVPVGESRTYGEMARKLATAPRAVGGACGANPIALVIPCHRVVGSQGSLGVDFGGSR